MRSALTLLAAAVGAVAVAAPAAQAHEMLGAPPAYAQPGACYAHVRRAAQYAPPPGPHGAWRLTPAGPGQPGPTWCFVTEPGGPPVLLRPAVDGWIRVRCPHRVVVRPHPRPKVHRVRCTCRPVHHRPRPRPRPAPRPCCVAPPPAPCCLRPTTPPPPPVVVLHPYNPAAYYGAPGPRVLTWDGKR
ncbi:MAG: hypothetical protein INR64_03140 [Caulobacteraceae bacterium]|nr:hypothetical protein [Caulobacter sp.]